MLVKIEIRETAEALGHQWPFALYAAHRSLLGQLPVCIKGLNILGLNALGQSDLWLMTGCSCELSKASVFFAIDKRGEADVSWLTFFRGHGRKKSIPKSMGVKLCGNSFF